jgi:hypothetical protein
MSDDSSGIENQEANETAESQEVLQNIINNYKIHYDHISTDPKKPWPEDRKKTWTVEYILREGALKNMGFTQQLSINQRRKVGKGTINYLKQKAPEALEFWMSGRLGDIFIDPMQRGLFEQAKKMQKEVEKSA